MAASNRSKPPAGARERVAEMAGRGYTPHILLTLYVVLSSVWLVLQPRSTFAFLVFLFSLLAIYYAPVQNWLKLDSWRAGARAGDAVCRQPQSGLP